MDESIKRSYVMPNMIHPWRVATGLNSMIALCGYYYFLDGASLQFFALWKFSLAANHGISLDLKLGVRNRERRNGDESATREAIAGNRSAEFS